MLKYRPPPHTTSSQILKDNHHLKHDGRMQFGLFLKGKCQSEGVILFGDRIGGFVICLECQYPTCTHICICLCSILTTDLSYTPALSCALGCWQELVLRWKTLWHSGKLVYIHTNIDTRTNIARYCNFFAQEEQHGRADPWRFEGDERDC